jgi:hypothetical protein
MNVLVPNFVANQKSGFEITYSLMVKGLGNFEKLITLNSQAVIGDLLLRKLLL